VQNPIPLFWLLCTNPLFAFLIGTYPMTQALHVDALPVPDGFEPVLRGSAFVQLIGPFYHKRTEDGRHLVGVRIDERHTNIKGMAHGGLLATLADSALGVAIAMENEDQKPMVTVNLSTDFVEAAWPGDWVEAHVDLQRVGGRLAFANCFLMVGERRILRASGVFAAAGKVG
jgi:uncharacterized protein (TIGR00369 family)